RRLGRARGRSGTGGGGDLRGSSLEGLDNDRHATPPAVVRGVPGGSQGAEAEIRATERAAAGKALIARRRLREAERRACFLVPFNATFIISRTVRNAGRWSGTTWREGL